MEENNESRNFVPLRAGQAVDVTRPISDSGKRRIRSDFQGSTDVPPCTRRAPRLGESHVSGVFRVY